jgi:hypothetical protein
MLAASSESRLPSQGVRIAALFVCLFLLLAAPVQAADKATFNPEADAWVSDAAPDANHGSDILLPVNSSSPTSRVYLRFNGSAPAGTVVTRKTLRLYFSAASSVGLEVRGTASSVWDESTITFNSASSLGLGTPGAVGPVREGWNDYSVPLTGASVTYVITRSSGESVAAQSRENLNKPELVVEYTIPSTTPTSACYALGCLESRPGIYTQSLATTVADFNGDGRDDRLVGTHGYDDRIELQQPDGSFAPGFQLPLADRFGCAAGDVNLDSRVDLFCMTGAGGGEGTKQNELWIARPDGTYINQGAAWGLADPYGRGRLPVMLDFNNDGLLDLYITNLAIRPDGQRSENILFLNTGTGSFQEAMVNGNKVKPTGPWGNNCVGADDWDRDGYKDLFVCGTRLQLFRNAGGLDTDAPVSLLNAAPRDATFADLNGDGWDDLVAVTARALQIRLNLGPAADTATRFAQVARQIVLVDGKSVAIGDLTGDGVNDIYVVQGSSNGGNADDLVLVGPNWDPLIPPPADTGVGDTAEFIDIRGQKSVIVTNGDGYASGPVQFVSFRPAPPVSQGTPAPSPGSPSPAPVGTARLPSAAQVIKLPSSRRCVNRRGFRIRIRNVAGVQLVSAKIFLNGKRVKTVTRNLAAPISLRRLPKRRFVAKVVVTTVDGRKLSRSRRYRSCSVKRGSRRHR